MFLTQGDVRQHPPSQPSSLSDLPFQGLLRTAALLGTSSPATSTSWSACVNIHAWKPPFLQLRQLQARDPSRLPPHIPGSSILMLEMPTSSHRRPKGMPRSATHQSPQRSPCRQRVSVNSVFQKLKNMHLLGSDHGEKVSRPCSQSTGWRPGFRTELTTPNRGFG